jgi:hypothetical protein
VITAIAAMIAAVFRRYRVNELGSALAEFLDIDIAVLP